MGLDMYLTMHRHFSNYDEGDKLVMEKINEISPSGLPVRSITYRAAYWRKANQIHKWFVDNVQEGIDNCGTYYVPENLLQDLLDVCKQVQGNTTLAQSLLPPEAGFFFGGQDIDEGYWHDIEITIKQITKALESRQDDDYFEYSSSW
jgi:hypothetical protein